MRQIGKRGVAAILGVGLVIAAPAQALELRSTYIPAESSTYATTSLLLGLAEAGDRLVAVGARGHVLLSDDHGVTWKQARLVPTQTTLTAVMFLNPQEGWAVGHDTVVLHTTDAGETWQMQYVDTEFGNPLLTVLFLDEKHGFAMGALGMVLETGNGGRTWVERSLGRGEVGELNLNKLVRSGRVLYVASEFGIVYRSDDLGKKFYPVQAPSAAAFLDALALPDGTVVFSGTGGEIWRGAAGLKSWTKVASGTEGPINALALTLDGRLVAVGLGGFAAFGERDDVRLTPVPLPPAEPPGVTLTLTETPDYAAAAPGPRGELIALGSAGIRRLYDGAPARR